jgi:hypothetical protein
MSIILYSVYTLACLLLDAWGMAVWRQACRMGTLLILLVSIGVAYHNLILSLGKTLGVRPLLLRLSVPRFLLRQLLLLWLNYAGFEQSNAAGHKWANHRASGWAILALTLLVVLLGVITRLVSMQLEPEVMDGVARYVAVRTAGPPLVSILSIGFAGIVGLLLWRKNGWPWQFLATLIVSVGEGIRVEWVRRGLDSVLRILFLVVMLATDRWLALRRD